MASRTISTSDDVEYGLSFLAKQAGKTAEVLFAEKVGAVLNEAVHEADEKRFELAKKMLDEKDKGASIVKLRELLGA